MNTVCNYHNTESGLAPAERVQKRVVLHQVYRRICPEINKDFNVLYFTFGGAGLWDVLDLLVALDPQKFAINAYSYEQKLSLIKEASGSHVFKQLNRLTTVNIELVNGSFPEVYLDSGFKRTSAQTAIYFLDWKDVFSNRYADDIAEVIKHNLVCEGDFIVITSSLNERVINQESFQELNNKIFEQYYGECSPEIRRRNFVELLINRRIRKKDIWVGMEERVKPKSLQLLAKYVYRDSSRMGVWLFKVYDSKNPGLPIPDSEFIDYLELSKTTNEKTVFNPFL